MIDAILGVQLEPDPRVADIRVLHQNLLDEIQDRLLRDLEDFPVLLHLDLLGQRAWPARPGKAK